MAEDWDTFWKWEWFRRDQWLGEFRKRKRNSPLAFKALLDEIGGASALDCSCGFGLKTIVLKELGVGVSGSDASALAVGKARELAAREGLEIEYFVSDWAKLPERTSQRFDGVFSDALCWLTSRQQFEEALAGIRGVLRPGGIFVFMGAEKDSQSDPQSRHALLESTWQRRPKFSVEWTFRRDAYECTSLLAREKGQDYIDEHHLFVIREGQSVRLETATIRQPVCWSWVVLEELFSAAGFSDLATRSFGADSLASGQPSFALNVVRK